MAEPTIGTTPDAEAGTGPVVRDRRRLDPETGQVRGRHVEGTTEDATAASAAAGEQAPSDASPADASPADAPPSDAPPSAALQEESGELVAARALADERLADLQRLQAEFVNYRRRVERDRDVAREAAVAAVLDALLPVLDDIHLARQHGDLESGPFAAIADQLEAPHDALMHTEAELAEGTTATTVVQVLQPGYRSGERVLRAARVAVADPH
jgi:molecular chaperone GrpE